MATTLNEKWILDFPRYERRPWWLEKRDSDVLVHSHLDQNEPMVSDS
jgi:hypothetical protein